MSFDQLGLMPELLRAVADQGYTEPTPVQSASIPFVLAGRDLLAGAQTGTGKTAAFVLPMLQHLSGESARPVDRRAAPRRAVRALVLVPTRELALQVE
ncbi:MAG: DEAD/DEAH box helicase, partial [Zetaproteobacteria bacterium]